MTKTIFLSACLPLMVSCATKTEPEQPEEEEKDKIPPSQVVGRISSVSPHGKFVLIQKFGAGKLPTTGIYQTIGEEGNYGSIRPSGERVRDFYAADITAGEIKSGDAVIFRPMASDKSETEEEVASENIDSADASIKTIEDNKTASSR